MNLLVRLQTQTANFVYGLVRNIDSIMAQEVSTSHTDTIRKFFTLGHKTDWMHCALPPHGSEAERRNMVEFLMYMQEFDARYVRERDPATNC